MQITDEGKFLLALNKICPNRIIKVSLISTICGVVRVGKISLKLYKIICFGGIKMKIIITTLLIVLSFHAVASDWIKIASVDDVNVFVDKASYKFEDKYIVKIWVKTIFPTNKIYDGRSYNSVTDLAKYDCLNSTVYIVRREMHLNKSPTYTLNTSAILFEEIIPDSIDDATKNYACQLKIKLNNEKS